MSALLVANREAEPQGGRRTGVPTVACTYVCLCCCFHADPTLACHPWQSWIPRQALAFAFAHGMFTGPSLGLREAEGLKLVPRPLVLPIVRLLWLHESGFTRVGRRTSHKRITSGQEYDSNHHPVLCCAAAIVLCSSHCAVQQPLCCAQPSLFATRNWP